MGLSSAAKFALLISFFGTASFICGVIAENKKPPFGTPLQIKGMVYCKYPSDPTILLGSLSVVCLFITSFFGFLSVYFDYNGKRIPTSELFSSTTLRVFFGLAIALAIVSQTLMAWATSVEGLHRNYKHHDMNTECTTAKTGLFGGAAFLAFDTAIFWLICQMLTLNSRSDYFDEDDHSVEYGQVMINV